MYINLVEAFIFLLQALVLVAAVYGWVYLVGRAWRNGRGASSQTKQYNIKTNSVTIDGNNKIDMDHFKS